MANYIDDLNKYIESTNPIQKEIFRIKSFLNKDTLKFISIESVLDRLNDWKLKKNKGLK